MSTWRAKVGWVTVVVAWSACSDTRDRGDDPIDCPTWRGDIAAQVAARCESCHSGDEPAGSYDLTSYQGALGAGSDEQANAIAGDSGSRIIQILGAGADETHAPFSDLQPAIQTWVVDCELAYVDSRIHERGLMNPADSDFHGQVLRDLAYDFSTCADCHGADFTGGTSKAACTTCHTEGPKECTTCHGPTGAPRTGAHTTHLQGGPLGEITECSTCHVVPEQFDAVGHALLADGTVDPPPAEVTFGDAAGDSASWDATARSCSGVYCHGATLGDPAAAITTPMWDGAGQAECGTCHGFPPENHGGDERCGACHPQTVVGKDTLDVELHIDGLVEFADDCSACHGGGAAGAAPPRALDGSVDTASIGVGAHASHVLGLSRLRGPIPCSDCHIEPDQLLAPGHADTELPAEVFPPGWTSIAAADGATPTWDRAAETCSGVYCHGNGNNQRDDTSSGLHRSPQWTRVGLGEAACGTCHGAPPGDSAHAAVTGLTQCAECHPQTVDSFGAILVTGPPGAESEHINGTVDF